ncbi:MAG TPA: hypothetical protein VFV58_18570 [Blastocatellia bacterium]|jgi:hypothetical protein|nr:hypothetical protein [Blastocatellia bacterium]
MNRRNIVVLVSLLVASLASLVVARHLLAKGQDRSVAKQPCHTAATVKSDSKSVASCKNEEFTFTPVGDDPPGTIDGAKTPWLISDDKAYETFFLCATATDITTEAQKTLAKAKFSRARIDKTDTERVLTILSEFRQHRSIIITAADRLRDAKAPANEFAKLQEKELNLIRSTRNDLQSRLSQDGATKMQQFILGLKSKIRLIPAMAE